MTLGQRLRSRLIEIGMTQAACAAAVGVSKRTVEKWVANERTPGGPALNQLAQVLGVSRRWLEGGTDK